MWKFQSNIVPTEFAFFVSLFVLCSPFFFSFLQFLETGKVKSPLPQTGMSVFGRCGNLQTVPTHDVDKHSGGSSRLKRVKNHGPSS